MERKHYKFLLGATRSGCIVFGEFGFGYSHDQPPYFSASFDTVRPFNEDDIDERYVEDYLGGFDKETLYDMCENYHCAPQDLAEEYFEDNPVTEIVDCSLYPEEINIRGNVFAFESDACGQHDCLDEMDEFVDEVAVRKLFGLWNSFHLYTPKTDKEQKDLENQVDEIVAALSETSELDWIENYIKKHYLGDPDIDEEDEDEED